MIDQETGEFVPLFIRSAFNYDVDRVSRETALHCVDPSLTDQSQAKQADINEIVRQFGVTGVLPNQPLPEHFGDFTGVGDYRSSLEAVRRAAEEFMELPAELRSRFDNDPAKLIDFLSVEANRHEAFTLGLVDADVAPTPEAPAVQAAANAAASASAPTS